jgi:hypothetical protein
VTGEKYCNPKQIISLAKVNNNTKGDGVLSFNRILFFQICLVEHVETCHFRRFEGVAQTALARREKYNTRIQKLNILKNAGELRSQINCERGKGINLKPAK